MYIDRCVKGSYSAKFNRFRNACLITFLPVLNSFSGKGKEKCANNGASFGRSDYILNVVQY